jgi:hypothetical protein
LQWNDIVNAQTQAVAWTTIAANAIAGILANPDYALNASAEEVAYVSAIQVQYQTFSAQQPVNPDA